MKKEMEKTYNHIDVEDRIYENWQQKKYFHPEIDQSKKPYTIVIPPPNITSQLHMGHALDCSVIDILIRFKRMQGYNALWVPGTDHASIATEVKIVEKMAEEGLTKKGIGREEFLKRAWEWKKLYGGKIVNQIKKLGASCDWDRERFTMDEGLNNAVLEVFVRLYEKNLIYRGEKLINWCSNCQTSISDAEVEHEDKEGALYHFKYPIKGTDSYLQFATTRPETMLGDTAIAVNPNDERYTGLIGKTAIVPIVDREIPIIPDDYVDIKYGTGVVKITPGHDHNDFMVGERHNLPRINILNDNGTLNENTVGYQGLNIPDARKKIIEEFKMLGLYVKTEKINHAVGVHDRCKEIIEPRLKTQWFVKMEELAKPAINVYKSGELRIFPERFGKIYLHWLENIRDWCISRQLWWGHRIPAYYCQACGEIVVSKTAPESCLKCGKTRFEQDEDVLDTWFSSALWPFSTLGWPERTPDFEYFYPTNVLSCGWEILFFWGVRMVFSGIEHTGKLPFKDLLFHGLIRAEDGRKMSKSLGNGVDPLDIIKDFGTDAMRLTIISGNTMGADFRFQTEKLTAYRNFCNKIWNAARFIMMNMEDDSDGDALPDKTPLTDTDKWIISTVNKLSAKVTEHLENYDLGMAASKIYEFIWDEFCDWSIEFAKPRLYNKEDAARGAALYTLKYVFLTSMRLLHPFMPFITEEIFTSLQSKEETVMFSKWPKYSEENNFPEEEEAVFIIKDAVKAIRLIRTDMNVPAAKKAAVYIVSPSPKLRKIFEKGKSYLIALAQASNIIVSDTEDSLPENRISAVISGATLFMPFTDLVDPEKEKVRLEKEKIRLENEVNRVASKLKNRGFIDKAPANVIEDERKKELNYKEMLEKINGRIALLK